MFCFHLLLAEAYPFMAYPDILPMYQEGGDGPCGSCHSPGMHGLYLHTSKGFSGETCQESHQQHGTYLVVINVQAHVHGP